MNKKIIISAILFLLGIAFLFLPMTYYGFLDYIVENTVINMNINRDTLETDKAAIAIYNGAGLTFLSKWVLDVLAITGFLFIYATAIVSVVGRKVLTKKYWTTFSFKP